MRIEDIPNVGGMSKVRVVNYGHVTQLGEAIENAKYHIQDRGALMNNWYGSSYQAFLDATKRGDVAYVPRAEKLVDRFANLAIADYDVDMEYNTQIGVLDYHAALAGDPNCMFGPAMVETDRSPVQIYLDCWTSCTISPKAMETRGIAVLALAMALSVFRPVRVKVVTGLQHSPTRTNMIQIIDVPTAPMDISYASWMLASPAFFRRGLLMRAWDIAESKKWCGIPRLSNVSWQLRDMGKWLADQDGVNDFVFLPHMLDQGQWGSEEYALSWVKQQLARFAPQKPN